MKDNPALHFQVMQPRDVTYLDEKLLDADGNLRVLPASVYEDIPWEHLRLWTHFRAIYGLPTIELVEYLKKLIGGRSAIEIGSGNGVLGRALGIPRTDNFMQTWPDVKLLYTLQGQPTITYGSDVEEMDAIEAIRKYKPEVVVASWVTQFSDGSRPGSMYGPDEEVLLSMVRSYMMFGSIKNHDHKVICNGIHQIIREPWMWSRAQDSALFIWG